MSNNEKFEINTNSPPYILYAPKLKLKKPTISPNPFVLNDYSYEEETKSDDDSYNSSDDEYPNEDNNFQTEVENSITSYTLKIKKTIKQ